MMKTEEVPIRVLIVDDSAFMRKRVGDILRQNGMDVVGTASDGLVALEKMRALHPDVITMDVEMPRMDGLACLRTLMVENPTPVVMLSAVTEAGADTTLKCLEAGALDCLHKPSGSISLDINTIGVEITARVKAAAGVDRRRLRRGCKTAERFEEFNTLPKLIRSGQTLRNDKYPVVAIASSTGGPAALNQVMSQLSANNPAAYVLVQHLPKGFTKALAGRLNTISALEVREADSGDALAVGRALVAPAGLHMAFDARGQVVLLDEPPLWGVKPAADVTLRSVAELYGSRALAVVLTGMGRDGALGAKAIRTKGGGCFAQNEETCIVYGMPRATVELGAVERLISIDEMGKAIQERVEAMANSAPVSCAAPS